MIVQILFGLISFFVISLHIEDGLYLLSGLEPVKKLKRYIQNNKEKIVYRNNATVVTFTKEVKSTR